MFYNNIVDIGIGIILCSVNRRLESDESSVAAVVLQAVCVFVPDAGVGHVDQLKGVESLDIRRVGHHAKGKLVHIACAGTQRLERHLQCTQRQYVGVDGRCRYVAVHRICNITAIYIHL